MPNAGCRGRSLPVVSQTRTEGRCCLHCEMMVCVLVRLRGPEEGGTGEVTGAGPRAGGHSGSGRRSRSVRQSGWARPFGHVSAVKSLSALFGVVSPARRGGTVSHLLSVRVPKWQLVHAYKLLVKPVAVTSAAAARVNVLGKRRAGESKRIGWSRRVWLWSRGALQSAEAHVVGGKDYGGASETVRITTLTQLCLLHREPLNMHMLQTRSLVVPQKWFSSPIQTIHDFAQKISPSSFEPESP